MQVRKIRAEMRMGRSFFDLPLRATFYARVSTEKIEQLSSLENQVRYYQEFIAARPNWTYVEGYVDEGISGTSTKKRDSFNRMIADAKAGLFDFIITKEISRFSRSTLDSIKYTQELLECDVGVFFKKDNNNTLDKDSEFRLVVMAGVAQDEVRKLSERLKFGFRQSIRNGRVLGNDKIWGYDKKNCQLIVNEEEAEVVRLVFDLYANQKLGIRRSSQKLYDMGYTSRRGNEFNVATIRHILTNPKYKGWYCGHKTQSVDYRTKKNVPLDPSEWVVRPDPNIPAIVSEELWDRANELYKSRSAQMRAHRSAAEFHNRYAYSGKLVCEEHNAGFHRRLLAGGRGDREVWQCRVYRQRGRAACSAPQLTTAELDVIMARIFRRLVPNHEAVVDALADVVRNVPERRDHERGLSRVEADIAQLHAKKDRLLEMNIEGVVDMTEFRSRNEGFNERIRVLERRLQAMRAEQEKSASTVKNLDKIKAALRRALTFTDGVDSRLAATILDRIVVKRDSTKDEIRLAIRLKVGGDREARFDRETFSLRFISS